MQSSSDTDNRDLEVSTLLKITLYRASTGGDFTTICKLIPYISELISNYNKTTLLEYYYILVHKIKIHNKSLQAAGCSFYKLNFRNLKTK